MKEIKFDQLDIYSEFPKLYMDNKSTKKKLKTTKQVFREFEIDKWGTIHQKFNNKFIDINNIENEYYNLKNEYVFFENGKFFLDKHLVILNKHILIYEKILSKYVTGASALVELGSGFGSKIIRLANKEFAKNIPLFAGELTKSGQELIRNIAVNMNIPIEVGFIDLREKKVSNSFNIPKNAVIFTSYAAHYDPNMDEEFTNFLAHFKPKAVINFEPCYEFYSSESLHGLMCKKYVEINDYTTNIWSSISNFCIRKKLNYKITKNIIGFNPFMPISIVEWGF